MNGKLWSMFACFLPYCNSNQENVGKKIGQKILPKDSKRMRLVWIFGILAVRELLFCLRYRSFGSLMPVCNNSQNTTTFFKIQQNLSHIWYPGWFKHKHKLFFISASVHSGNLLTLT
jgi:hypothetical protein